MITTITALAAMTIANPGQEKLNKAHTFEGKPAPVVVGNTTDGAKISTKDMKGKVVLLDFWATWCGPCKAAGPTMQAMHKKYWGKGLRVVGVSGDGDWEQDTSKNPIAKYKSEHNYGFTFMYNNGKAFKDYGITSIPQFVLIGKDGKVVDSWEGFSAKSSPGAMERAISAALAK